MYMYMYMYMHLCSIHIPPTNYWHNDEINAAPVVIVW